MPNWKKIITSGSEAKVKTLLISDTADGDALIGNSNILHEGSNTTAANLTVGTATNATNATNVTTAADSGNAEHFVTFTDSAAATQQLKTDAGAKYNPSTNTMTIGRLAGTVIDAGSVTVSDSFDLRAGNGGIGTSGGLTSVGITNSSTYTGQGRLTLTGGASSYVETTGYLSSSVSVNAPTGSFDVLTGDTSAGTGLEVNGSITASGEIISDNIETFWTSFNCDGDANFATSIYGPNTQGINYYFWNKNWTSTTADGGNPTGDHVHRTEINTGWYVPYKIKIVALCGGLHDGGASATSDCEVGLWNTAASFASSDLDSNVATTKEFIVSGSVTLNGNRWKHFSQTCDVTLEEGQYVLPRVRMGSNITNLRGQFTIKYKRVQ